MGTEPDPFTFVQEHIPCTLVKTVDEQGLREGFDRGVEQIVDHRRRNGARASNGPTAAWLRDVLAGHGIIVDDQVIRRHVNETCSCYRNAAV